MLNTPGFDSVMVEKLPDSKAKFPDIPQKYSYFSSVGISLKNPK
jgi:hypothetical protein